MSKYIVVETDTNISIIYQLTRVGSDIFLTRTGIQFDLDPELILITTVISQ